MKRRQFVTWAGTLAATGTLGVTARAQAQESAAPSARREPAQGAGETGARRPSTPTTGRGMTPMPVRRSRTAQPPETGDRPNRHHRRD